MGGRSATCRRPTEDRGGLRDYSTMLHPGEHLTAAIAAGGAVCTTTSGESGHLYTSNPMWVTIALPAEADLRAANRG
eukprot:5797101-Pyramimonas_sp.AAC.1